MSGAGASFLDLVRADPLLGGDERLLALARPGVRLREVSDAVPGVPDAVLAGTSRLGGRPALPPGTPWPAKGDSGVSIPFIAQLALAELAPFDAEGLLPDHGILSVFYDPEGAAPGEPSPWNLPPGGVAHGTGEWDFYSPIHCRALWHPESGGLVPADPPADLRRLDRPKFEGGTYGVRALEPEAEMTLPDPEDDVLVGRGGRPRFLSDAAWEAYAELWSEWRDGDRSVHRVLGNAMPNQRASLWAGYARARQAFYDPQTPTRPPFPPSWDTELRRFRLLLQVETPGNGVWFGREGTLCVFVHQDDLARRVFERVWFAV